MISLVFALFLSRRWWLGVACAAVVFSLVARSCGRRLSCSTVVIGDMGLVESGWIVCVLFRRVSLVGCNRAVCLEISAARSVCPLVRLASFPVRHLCLHVLLFLLLLACLGAR